MKSSADGTGTRRVPGPVPWLLLSLLTPSSATAANPGYWDPETVRETSRVFAEAGGEGPRRSEALDTQVQRAATALQELLDGCRFARAASVSIPGDEEARVASLTARFETDFAAAQAFVDGWSGDFAAAFEAAIERATSQVQRARGISSVAVCRDPSRGGRLGAALPTGPSGPGAGPRGSSPCAGENLNAAIVAGIDGDARLREQLAAIAARPWPEVKLPGGPQRPLAWGPAADPVAHLRPAELVLRAEPGQAAIDSVEQALGEVQGRVDAAWEGLQRDREALTRDPDTQGGEAAAESLRVRARKLVQARDGVQAERERAQLRVATAVLDAAAAWARGQPEAVGLCVQPVSLGGCTGEERTLRAADALAGNRALDRALRKATAALVVPAVDLGDE